MGFQLLWRELRRRGRSRRPAAGWKCDEQRSCQCSYVLHSAPSPPATLCSSSISDQTPFPVPPNMIVTPPSRASTAPAPQPRRGEEGAKLCPGSQRPPRVLCRRGASVGRRFSGTRRTTQPTIAYEPKPGDQASWSTSAPGLDGHFASSRQVQGTSYGRKIAPDALVTLMNSLPASLSAASSVVGVPLRSTDLRFSASCSQASNPTSVIRVCARTRYLSLEDPGPTLSYSQVRQEEPVEARPATAPASTRTT